MQVSDYTGLITSEHASAPKFGAMVAAVAGCFVRSQNLLVGIPTAFDLDAAVGAQLDVVGQWVGVARTVQTPITGVFFSLDTANVGFDQGVWLDAYNTATALISLDDDTYRLLLRAKIGTNSWDGTLASSKPILDAIFTGSLSASIEDNGDMTITMILRSAGKVISALLQAIFLGGYLHLKSEGVQVNYVITNDTLFGFDSSGSVIAGFDSGTWASFS